MRDTRNEPPNHRFQANRMVNIRLPMKTTSPATAALLVSAALLPLPAFAKCELTSVELPVTMSGMQPIITARINDTDVKFMVDSGAFFSIIAPATAEQLKLTLKRMPYGMKVEGIGGEMDAYVTRVERFALKKAAIPNVEFIVGGNFQGGGTLGLLGQNVLSIGDIEYDLANGMIRIFYPNQDCRDVSLAYWAKSQPVIEVDLLGRADDRTRHTQAMVMVNDVKLRATFDTGAARSLMSSGAARRAGLERAGEGVVAAATVQGIGKREIKSWIAPVKSLTIGDENIKNTRMRFAEFELGDIDFLLGADFFLSHRIYVANSQNKIYMTYNGGPVFDLSTREKSVVADINQAPTVDDATTPSDALGYARRGAALVARREFERGLEDLTRACEMDPAIGRYFLQRGDVLVRMNKPELAIKDFNEALRLDPNDSETRVARARLHISAHDTTSAGADLAAADKALPAQAGLRMSLSYLYLRLQMFEATVLQLDQWIAAHPDDVTLATAYNNRCWARALMGSELNRALDDCDLALRARPGYAGYLDSRGMVYLRSGDLERALADYDVALKADPKMAWSLYGRGLIRLKRGETDAGNADITAAKALQPSIADDAKRYGIAL
jgi:tetratricopeptide (TPR) repeat protein